MKRILSLCLKCVLFAGLRVSAVLAPSLSLSSRGAISPENQVRGEIPEMARELVLRAGDLAAHDGAEEAIAGLHKAIAMVPNYVIAMPSTST